MSSFKPMCNDDCSLNKSVARIVSNYIFYREHCDKCLALYFSYKTDCDAGEINNGLA